MIVDYALQTRVRKIATKMTPEAATKQNDVAANSRADRRIAVGKVSGADPEAVFAAQR